MKFAFRNSGVGGHTIPTTLARFDYDIAAWKPTVVSVELGMNDQGGTPTPKYIENMGTMVDRIRAIKARPIILSASPINDGDTMAKLARNTRLNEYAVALKSFCAEKQIPYADQFHLLIDIWGQNKPSELLANSFGTLKLLAQNDRLDGVEHLRAFLAVQDKAPMRPVSMMGDPVHPGPTGQLMMAAALLKELGAESFVSSAVVDASGEVKEAKKCKIDAVKAENGKLSFVRLDECLPFPIPDEARAVLPLYPTILDLSQYMLKVTGLKEGSYLLAINGTPVATLTANQLGAGVNLTSFPTGPIAAQGKDVLGRVNSRAGIVGQWRNASRALNTPGAPAELKTQLDALTRSVEQADDTIRKSAQPAPLRFTIEPAKN
jgi:lysophospholipase L1-like esterase